VVTDEHKLAQQIIKILHEDRINTHKLKNRKNWDNPPYQVVNNADTNKTRKPKAKNVNNCNKAKKVEFPNVKSGKEKQRIIVLGDSHVKGLASQLKHYLNEIFEILGMAKPGSTLANVVTTTCSDLKTLKENDVCVIWGGTNDVDEMRLPWVFVR
jgi:hypothetical protein